MGKLATANRAFIGMGAEDCPISLDFRCGGGGTCGCCSQSAPGFARRKLPSAPFTDSLSGAGEHYLSICLS